MSKKKQFKIRRDDYYRVLTTEVLPYETPIIFNSFGLYNFLKFPFSSPTAIELQKKLNKNLKYKNTIPMVYKIKKNSYEFRRLKLIHPLSQVEIKKFYEKYEDLILQYCESSPISIRAPQSIAKSFYRKNLREDINKYKTNRVSTPSVEEISKYSPSFYTYRGFDRIYKFFDTKDFFNMEIRYQELCMTDISKCFDSIYTHSIAWAIKNKEFIKENVKASASFASKFDSLMQKMNHNETHGIVIGPEISRIFAEIILQEIDLRIIDQIKEKHGYDYNFQYTIKRYVDDFFIFSETQKIQNEILVCLSDTLSQFNLHLNTSKTEYFSRPFISNRSQIISNVRNIANSFFDKFLISENNFIKPLKINDKWKITKSFIHTIQSECKEKKIEYDQISNYLISTINNRIKKLTNTKNISNECCSNYLNAIEVLLDIQFFFFKVAPSVNSSYNLCTSIMLCLEFSKKNLNHKSKYLSKIIYDHIYLYLFNIKNNNINLVDNYLSIEAINLILISTKLDKEFLLPLELTLPHFSKNSLNVGYFHLASLLYYSSKYEKLSNIKEATILKIENQLNNLDDFCFNTNKAYLFFEALFHPDFNKLKKNEWIKNVLQSLSDDDLNSECIADSALDQFNTEISSHSWHIDWEDIDLLSCLQKKDLRQVY